MPRNLVKPFKYTSTAKPVLFAFVFFFCFVSHNIDYGALEERWNINAREKSMSDK